MTCLMRVSALFRNLMALGDVNVELRVKGMKEPRKSVYLSQTMYVKYSDQSINLIQINTSKHSTTHDNDNVICQVV